MPTTYPVELPDVSYFDRQVLCREGCPVHTDSGGYADVYLDAAPGDTVKVTVGAATCSTST